MNNTYYYSNESGKKAFVEERLKPLLISMDSGWENVCYVYFEFDKSKRMEVVKLINANPDKNLTVNVACDSIRALAEDVLRAALNI